jgi:hypothetical protein
VHNDFQLSSFVFSCEFELTSSVNHLRQSIMSDIGTVEVTSTGSDVKVPNSTVEAATNPNEVDMTDPEQRRIRQNLEEFEHLFGVDEDAYDQPTTTRKELWSYYLYYNGKHEVQLERERKSD